MHILLFWRIMLYYIMQARWQPALWWNRSNSQILCNSDFQWFLLITSAVSSNVLQFWQNIKSYMQMFISIHWDTTFLFPVLLKFRELKLLYNPCWLYDVCISIQWASSGFSFSKWSNSWCLFISSNWSTNLSLNTGQFQSYINSFHWLPAQPESFPTPIFWTLFLYFWKLLLLCRWLNMVLAKRNNLFSFSSQILFWIDMRFLSSLTCLLIFMI